MRAVTLKDWQMRTKKSITAVTNIQHPQPSTPQTIRSASACTSQRRTAVIRTSTRRNMIAIRMGSRISPETVTGSTVTSAQATTIDAIMAVQKWYHGGGKMTSMCRIVARTTLINHRRRSQSQSWRRLNVRSAAAQTARTSAVQTGP